MYVDGSPHVPAHGHLVTEAAFGETDLDVLRSMWAEAKEGGSDSFVWLGLRDPGRAEIDLVASVFGIDGLQVDDSLAASSRVAGSVHQSPDFDLVALEFTAPELGAALAVSEDVPQAGSVVTWELDPSLVVPGAPLFLRIAPESDDGVLYLGGDAPPELRPRLRVDYL